MKQLAAILLALAAACGCRRTDFRVCTLSVPGLDEGNAAKISMALRFYEGVEPETIAFDTEKKTVTLKYDTMKVALANLRMAIEAKGIEVEWPEKTGPAGYINERP